MRINEIVEPVIKTKKLQNPMDYMKMNANANNVKGNGSFAYGASIPSDPHVFAKKYRSYVVGTDGYVEYINAIIPYMGENPYFPRVFKITNIVDNTGASKPRFDIETLYEGHLLDPEELFPLFAFSFPDSELIEDDTPDQSNGSYVKVPIPGFKAFRSDVFDTSWKSLIYCIANTIRGDFDGINANPHLVEACRVINEVKDKYQLATDYHAGNFMVRRTVHGLQLVITDPLVKF